MTPWTVAHQALLSMGILQARILKWAVMMSSRGKVETMLHAFMCGFPGGSDGKESACDAGDLGSIPESGRTPGEGYGNPLQYSCLKNLMDRRAWQATVHGVTKSQTRLSD